MINSRKGKKKKGRKLEFCWILSKRKEIIVKLSLNSTSTGTKAEVSLSSS